MNDAFWQSLLAAELSSFKASSLLQELQRSRIDPLVFLRTHPRLTSAEKKRAETANMAMLERQLAAGVRIARGDQLPEGVDLATPAMFFLGDLSILDAPRISIVGTRRASTYGKAVAMKFAEHLARAGCTVISGGALGIDSSAHKGALSVGGKTCVVKPCAIESNWPAVHAELFRNIVNSGGLLVSQFATGAKTQATYALARNKLIAALSQVVLMIEVPERSGAITTASAALEFNRSVCVVPANISYPSFRGSHAMIRDGATLVDHPDQVLEMLGIGPLKIGSIGEVENDQQARIMATLSDDPIPPEKIAEQTGFDSSVVMAELTELELLGLVIRDGIGYAKRP